MLLIILSLESIGILSKGDIGKAKAFMQYHIAMAIASIIQLLPRWVYGRSWILHKCFRQMIDSIEEEINKCR